MKLHIFKTNRRIRESPFLTACKEKDGLLGNIEMHHVTNVDDYFGDYRVSPGDNLKYLNEWSELADRLNKPGVFDKLVQYFRK